MKSLIIKTALVNILLFFLGNVSGQVAAVHVTVHVPGQIALEKGVYISGSFNYWHAGDSMYRMNMAGEGIYNIILPLFDNKQYEYKYTLGSWDKVEVALNDSDIHNRLFISVDEKNITDTVVKWKQPGMVQNKTNPQMQKINAMKDSLTKRMKPELADMQQILGSYIQNFLQEKPNATTHKRLDKKMEVKLNHMYEQVTKLLWTVMTSLSPEQKKAMLDHMNKPGNKDDVLNKFGGAFGAVVEGKNPGP